MKQGRLLEILETIVVVTVISCLIWLYAEGETISTQSKKITVRFVAPVQDLVVSTLDVTQVENATNQIKVDATIQASRGDWARINDWLRQNTIDIEVADPGTALSEDQTINLKDALNLSQLDHLNAFVKEVEKDTVKVRVQSLEDVQMGIRIERGSLELSDQPNEMPTIFNESGDEPISVISVKMPVELADLVKTQKLRLIANLDQLDPSTLTPGVPLNYLVDLDLPPELQNKPFVSLNMDSVRVKFIIRKQTETLQLERVQVKLLITDELTGKYNIRIDPESQRFIELTLSGSTNAIRSIRENESLVNAWINIKLSDLTDDTVHSATLIINVPTGVEYTVTKPADITTITYSATKLETTP